MAVKAKQRTGLLAEKVGMTRIFNEQGKHVPVTVLKVDRCQVVAVRKADKEGYSALQVSHGSRKAKNVSKAMRGHFAKAKVEPAAALAEFRVSPDALLEVGVEISAAHFLAGQIVDVCGITIGRGFQGVIKRHNFGGGRASHGASITHRAHGSTGMRQDPGRVFKNKKMAGHMGVVRVTTENMTVVSVDADQGLIFVQGAVPGAKGSVVRVRDAVKQTMPKDAPFPAALKQTAAA